MKNFIFKSNKFIKSDGKDILSFRMALFLYF